jgi:deoxyribose-phosphate aldolase
MENDIAPHVELLLASDLPSRTDIERLCATARRQNYRGVIIPSGSLLLAQHFMEDSPLKLSCRIGFPHGAADADVKRYETEFAIDSGAHEIELLPSLGKIVDGDFKSVLREIRDVAEAADERPLKVAIQAWRWEPAVLRELVGLVLDSGTHYLSITEKDDLQLLRALCGPKFGIAVCTVHPAAAARLIPEGANLVALEHSSTAR